MHTPCVAQFWNPNMKIFFNRRLGWWLIKQPDDFFCSLHSGNTHHGYLFARNAVSPWTFTNYYAVVVWRWVEEIFLSRNRARWPFDRSQTYSRFALQCALFWYLRIYDLGITLNRQMGIFFIFWRNNGSIFYRYNVKGFLVHFLWYLRHGEGMNISL